MRKVFNLNLGQFFWPQNLKKMSKTAVLASLEELTINQAKNLSLNTTGTDSNRMVAVKNEDGEGFSGSLSELTDDFYALSVEDREWVISEFYVSGQQAVGGRPQCPVC